MAMDRIAPMAVSRRWHAAVIAVGLSMGVWLHAQTEHKTVRRHRVVEPDNSFPPELTQAENAIEKKDFATAEPLLQKVVGANPNNYQAWFDLGFVLNATGKPEESISAYRKSVEAKSDVFESNLNLGLMLAKLGNPEAEQFLRAATKLKPTAQVEEGHYRAWLSLAHVLEASRPDEAIAAYQQAATLHPKDPEPHLSAGLLLEKQGRPADAEQEYKQAMEFDGGSADALTGLVNLYTRGKRYGEAEELLRKLAVQRPEDAGVRMQLGRMLAASGKKDEAITELEHASKLVPGDLSVQRDLGDLYSEAGKFPQAEGLYRKLQAANPNDPELHYGLGRTLLKQRKFPEAQQEFVAAVKLKPDFAEAYWNLAVAANENQNYPLAIQAADARAKFPQEPAMSLFLKATAYDHLLDVKQASLNYHRFLEVANGKYPDQEWQARHRLVTLEHNKK